MDFPGFGAMLAQTLLLLVVVAVLALVTLRLAAKYGIGLPGGRAPAHKKLEVLERIGLGGRQHVVALRVADRVVVVGQSAGQMSTLAELPHADWSGGASFADVLDRTPVPTNVVPVEDRLEDRPTVAAEEMVA